MADPFTAMAVVQGVTGIMGAKSQAKANKQARGDVLGGQQRGLDAYFGMEERMGGVPEMGEFTAAQFRTLSDEDYDALQESIFQERIAMWQDPFDDAMRGIAGEEERRGISSLGTEQRYRLASRVGDMFQKEAAQRVQGLVILVEASVGPANTILGLEGVGGGNALDSAIGAAHGR